MSFTNRKGQNHEEGLHTYLLITPCRADGGGPGRLRFRPRQGRARRRVSVGLDSLDGITTPTRHIVQVPVSIGGRAFRVTSGFVNLIWPSAADMAAAVASGVLVSEAGSTVEVHYCALLP